MDDNARRRRQNEPQIGAASTDPRYPASDPSAQHTRRPYGAGAPERYRPAPINTSPSATRGMGGTAAYSGYYQDSAQAFSAGIPQSSMSYQGEYAQDGRQAQGFGGYNPSMMYNVPQAGAQSAVYDANPQFPSRQTTGLPMMSTDVAAAPYFPGEPSSATAASNMHPQTASSSSSAMYQQSPQNYQGGMAQMGGMAQAAAEADQSMEDQYDQPSAEMGEAYAQYQTALRETFTSIRDGALQTASQSLLTISQWLLTKAADLGLAGDNPTLHNDRIAMWHDFNHAWLSLFQKQKDMLDLGVALQRGQSLLSVDTIKSMGQELIKLCDGIERHGLVDYEYGVWEEKIIEIITACLDQLEELEQTQQNSHV